MSAEPVTDDELAEIGRLDREATPGPWRTNPVGAPGRGWRQIRNDAGSIVRLEVVHHADDGTDFGLHVSEADAGLIVASRTLLPKLAASERANRRSLDEANAALKRMAAEVDDLRAKVATQRAMLAETCLEAIGAGSATRKERDRVRRLFDHHLTGLAVDDDTRQRLEAFVRDVAAGVDRRPA